MSTLRELLCQLTGFLKPMMDRAVEDPLYRMHHGRNTFTLEINWAYAKESSEKIEKKIIPVTQKQDGCRLSRRNLERNRRRRERGKAARALQRSSAKSPIVISPAKTNHHRSPMETADPSGETPPPPEPKPEPEKLRIHFIRQKRAKRYMIRNHAGDPTEEQLIFGQPHSNEDRRQRTRTSICSRGRPNQGQTIQNYCIM